MTIQALYPEVRPSLNLDFAQVKKLDPRITFTRASSATYYNGVTTAKAEENFLLYSQEFNNAAWTKAGSSITANATTAPDGTTTADTLTATIGLSFHGTNQAVATSASARVASVFAKKGTNNYIQLCTVGDADPFANFDLDLGVVGTKRASVTSSITAFPDGWYRCTMEYTSAAATAVDIEIADSASMSRRAQWTALGTETVFLWGAQVEQRSTVTAYTPTTTQPITNYIPTLLTATDNVARFDHNPTTGESLGLLVEEQRTNLVLRSEEFDNAAWSKANATITANTIVAPNGTLTGDKFVINSGQANTGALAVQDITKSATATTYTYTVYGKIGEFNQLQLVVRETANSANNATVRFSLIDGTIISAAAAGGTFTNASASVGVSVGNGWYRFALSFTSSTETSIRVQTIARDSVATTGNGYSGIYLWGAQLEAGAIATSYIPTVASQVTRSIDVVTITGANFSSWYSQGEGTIYIENNRYSTTGFPGRMRFSDGTGNNTIDMYYDAAFNQSAFDIKVNGTATVNIYGGGNALNTSIKSASAWKTNDAAVVYNELVQGTDTSCFIPSNIDQIRIGNAITGTIRKLSYYPKRLTNAQLQALTS